MNIQSPNTEDGVAAGGAGDFGATSASRMASWRWRDWSLSTKGVAVLSVPLVMLAVSSGIFFSTSSSESAAQDRVTHLVTVRTTLEEVSADILDGETGIRGYLATGDAVFLAPTNEARARITAHLDRLATLVADDPFESARVTKLRALLAAGYQFSLTNVPPASDFAGRVAWLRAQKTSTDAIRGVLHTMTATEVSQLLARQRTASHERKVATFAVGAALLAGLFAGMVLMLLFTRGLARRLRHLLADADRLMDGRPLGEVDSAGDELGVLSRRLRTAVATRRELETEALEARRLVEAASEEKSRFLSRMSHELRTPLNAVLGFAQLLEMDALDGQLESLAQIRRAGRHLLDLINEVLDISRIESGTMTLSAEPVRLSEMISDVADLLAPMAAERRVTIGASDYANCPYFIQADRQRVKQVMLNLVSNAVKYNRPGGTVRFACQLVVGDRVRVDVIDSGIGMSEHDLERLFTPFERFAAAESDIEGSGIGLVLSQHLVHAMGGELTAVSRLGDGSTFTIVLPRAPEPSLASTHAVTEASARRVGDLRAARLLYIEDNISNVRLLEQLLRHRPNWVMVHAGHGQLGIELADSQSFDLVMLDLHLPDMAGAEVLGHLRAGVGGADVPVVVVSADATPGQIERLMAAGAYDYVTKPIDVEQMLRLLDEIAVSAD